jgi:hypothetical protein
MEVVIKTESTIIRRAYVGLFPKGEVIYFGSLNGKGYYSSIPMEEYPNPEATMADLEFNKLVEEARAKAYKKYFSRDCYAVNFVGEGRKFNLGDMLPHEAMRKFPSP